MLKQLLARLLCYFIDHEETGEAIGREKGLPVYTCRHCDKAFRPMIPSDYQGLELLRPVRPK